jgi:hypothetical protein
MVPEHYDPPSTLLSGTTNIALEKHSTYEPEDDIALEQVNDKSESYRVCKLRRAAE